MKKPFMKKPWGRGVPPPICVLGLRVICHLGGFSLALHPAAHCSAVLTPGG